MEFTTLHDVLRETLEGLLDADRALCSILPAVLPRISSQEVHGLLSTHLSDLLRRVRGLEELLCSWRGAGESRVSPVVNGFLEELCSTTAGRGVGALRDIAVLGVLCRMKHHHMAMSEMARSLVEVLEPPGFADLLFEHIAEDRQLETSLTVVLEDCIDTVCEGGFRTEYALISNRLSSGAHETPPESPRSSSE